MPDLLFGEAAGTTAFAPVVQPLPGATTDEPLFDAVATPNDSGTRHGRVLFAGVLAAYFAITLYAWLRLGAWPMAAYSLIVLAFAVWSMHADARRRRQAERIRIWPDRTLLERIDGAGRRSASEWQTAWLRLAVVPGGAGGPELRLTSHGRSETVGAFLTGPERLDLATALARHIGRAPAAR